MGNKGLATLIGILLIGLLTIIFIYSEDDHRINEVTGFILNTENMILETNS